jgi:hypothetical protein
MYYYYNTNDKRTFDVLPFGGFVTSKKLEHEAWPFVVLQEDFKGSICLEYYTYLCPVEKSKKTLIQRVNISYPSNYSTKLYSIT